MSNEPVPYDESPLYIRRALDALTERLTCTQREVNLLSGRVDLTLRLLARIVGKMDPAFTEDPINDPDVKRRSDLLTKEVLSKMKQDALAQASSDPEAFNRLQRYFKDINNA